MLYGICPQLSHLTVTPTEKDKLACKNHDSGERLRKDMFWTVGQTGGKKAPFSNKTGYVWTGPNNTIFKIKMLITARN